MDLDNIKSQVANLTLYDVKAGWRKAQNGKPSARSVFPTERDRRTNTLYAAVMNYTEMEAKVREATNNNPWGSSSSEMQGM